MNENVEFSTCMDTHAQNTCSVQLACKFQEKTCVTLLDLAW